MKKSKSNLKNIIRLERLNIKDTDLSNMTLKSFGFRLSYNLDRYIDNFAKEHNTNTSAAINQLLSDRLDSFELFSSEELTKITSLIANNLYKSYDNKSILIMEDVLNDILDEKYSCDNLSKLINILGFEARYCLSMAMQLYSNKDLRIRFVKSLQTEIEYKFDIELNIKYQNKKSNYFKSTDNLSKKVILAMLDADITLAKSIYNLDLDIQLDLVNKNVENIKYINNPCESVQIIAVNANADLIKYIESPTKNVRLIAESKIK